MDWDKKLDSSFLRDQNFEINGERMRVALRGFKISQITELVGCAVMAYISGIGFLYKISSVIAGSMASNVVNLFSGKNMDVDSYNSSGWLITLAIAVITAILSVLGNSFHIKKAAKITAFLYPANILIGILTGFGLFDDMNLAAMIFTIAYGLIGIWLNDLTLRGLKELDYLVTQEGFPSFNQAIFYFHRSHYVRMREKWLEMHPEAREQERVYLETEEKRSEMLEIYAEEEQAGVIPNISVTSASAEKWLEQNKLETDKKQSDSVLENAMDDLSTENLTLPDSDEYYAKSIQPKVKRH